MDDDSLLREWWRYRPWTAILIAALLSVAACMVFLFVQAQDGQVASVDGLNDGVPTAVLQAARAGFGAACTENVRFLHTVASSRLLTRWDLLRLRVIPLCRSFRFISAEPSDAPESWCVTIAYEYRNLGDEWVPAEAASRVTRAGEGWTVERGPWLQGAGQSC